MDIRLKERLIGATVLVLAAVIFIPMLLDGPGRNRQVSQSVALPESGSAGTERRTVRIGLDSSPASRPAPAPVDEPGEPVTVDLSPQQQSRPAEPAARESVAGQETAPAAATPRIETRPQSPSTPETAAPAQAAWTVQVGAFSRQGNADSLADKLKEIGYPAYVREFRDSNGVHYRVRVGGYPDRETAKRKADEIRGKTGEPARPAAVE